MAAISSRVMGSPRTLAASSADFAASGSLSTRAPITAAMEPGTRNSPRGFCKRYAPGVPSSDPSSISVMTSCSMKKGLPSARRTSSLVTAMHGRIIAKQGTGESEHLTVRQGPHQVLREPRSLSPLVFEIRPIADANQDRQPLEPGNQSLEQPLALAIGQEDILEHQHEGACLQTPAYEPQQGLADPTSPLCRIQCQPCLPSALPSPSRSLTAARWSAPSAGHFATKACIAICLASVTPV